jgi:hypothetical protein
MENTLGYQRTEVRTLRDEIINSFAPEVDGYFYDVSNDTNTDLINAYAAWDTSRRDLRIGLTDNSRCRQNATLAREVARQIKEVIRRILADSDVFDIGSYPTYLLLVGGDDVFPFFRVLDDDSPALHQEARYEGPLTDRRYPVAAAISQNYILTDEYYWEDTPRFDTQDLIEFSLPHLCFGRLVETPDEMSEAIRAFVETHGVIDLDVNPDADEANGILATGIGTLKDTAQKSRSLFEKNDVHPISGFDQGPPSSARLLEAMNEVNLDYAPYQQIQVHLLGLQSDHTQTYLTEQHQPLITTADFQAGLEASKMMGDLVYHLGSHSGLSVSKINSIPPPTNLGPELDHPQVFLGKGCLAFVGQTTFAGSSGSSQSLSEGLALQFWYEIMGSPGDIAVGKALRDAKAHYLQIAYRGNVPSVESLLFNTADHSKTILGGTLFGFPMAKIRTPSLKSAQSETTPGLNLKQEIGNKDGLNFDTFEVGIAAGLEIQTTTKGSFYTLGGNAQANNNEPLMPYITGFKGLAGNTGRGTLFLEGDFQEIPGFEPVIEHSAWIPGATVAAEGVMSATASAVWFPPLPFALNTVRLQPELSGLPSTFQQITYLFGQYHDMDSTFRLFSRMKTKTYYVLDGEQDTREKDRPSILSHGIRYAVEGMEIAISTDEPLTEAYVTYENNSIEWRSALFAKTDVAGKQWKATVPLQPCASYIVQVVDLNGNATIDTNQGAYFRSLGLPDLSGNGTVGVEDLQSLIMQWQGTGQSDLDCDSDVDAEDLLLLIDRISEDFAR